MMQAPAIRISSLSKSYRTGWPRRTCVDALRNVDFELTSGSVVAFVGPNGAGKTTTLNLLLGLLDPDRGTVEVFGESPRRTATRRRMGYMPELFQTYPAMTGREALWFYGQLIRIDKTTFAARSDRLLQLVGMSGAADSKIKTYSKGMNQRLGLAHALLGNPDLLLLDEPTSGLDPQGRKMIADIIELQKAQGTTVFLSSHILSDVESSCDRVLMVRDGQIVLDRRIDELRGTSGSFRIDVAGLSLETGQAVADNRVHFEQTSTGLLRGQVEAAAKSGLLRDLLAAGGDIVHLESTASLEEIYMQELERRD